MRTNSNYINASSLVQFLLQLVKGQPKSYDRGYDAHALIGFWTKSIKTEISASELRTAIQKIDAEFPWQDEPLRGEPYMSISYLSEGEVVVHECNTPANKVCWFELYPHRDLKRSQLYAYEKYINNLGEKLKKSNISGIDHVNVVFRVSKVEIFK